MKIYQTFKELLTINNSSCTSDQCCEAGAGGGGGAPPVDTVKKVGQLLNFTSVGCAAGPNSFGSEFICRIHIRVSKIRETNYLNLMRVRNTGYKCTGNQCCGSRCIEFWILILNLGSIWIQFRIQVFVNFEEKSLKIV